MIVMGILVSVLIVSAIELTFYMFLIPGPSPKPLHVRPLDKYVGRVAYFIAYILSLLRAPLGLLPYVVKLFVFFGLNICYESARSTYLREVINMIGDFVNRYNAGETIVAQDIASHYTYPLKYVEEVLLDKIETAKAHHHIGKSSNSAMSPI